MGLRRIARARRNYDTPLQMFQDIRPRKIAAPYAHQAQILRDYAADGIQAPDVAIQGATGSGKTLVGLLVAEWRRRQLRERTVYLCPTRQLVHQITAFATDQMGLPAFAFVGSKQEYPAHAKGAWRTGECIAIATYSALFNLNPFFSQPNFILADDAHAADQYIGEFWTVRVRRDQEPNKELFTELAVILRDLLPSDEAVRLMGTPQAISEHVWVQLVPAPLLWDHQDAISAVLDRAKENSDLAFRWSVIKGHLQSCQVYVCPYEITIRPIIAPTTSHPPFTSANQRLYMSATLGRGGELERLCGRRNIMRISSPDGWDGHGVGRRLFLFPSSSLEETESREVLIKMVKKAGRALYMVPSDKRADEVRELFRGKLPDVKIFGARQIERSKLQFIDSKNAIALISNRYDGIDFPNEECQLLIVEGRPAGTNLQERFLADKLGARALYSERIRTRIIQAFGRCTRSADDYALVLAFGHQLLDELLMRDNVALMDVEFQAELRYGQEQSQDTMSHEFLEMADEFFGQGAAWRHAEEDIANLREELEEVTPQELEALTLSAPNEIRYVESMWKGDYSYALDAAQCVLGALAGGDELKGYRAMWHYLSGCAAALDAKERGAGEDKANDHFRLAKNLANVRWLGRIQENARIEDDEETSAEDLAVVENLEGILCELGLTHAVPFSKMVTGIQAGIRQNKAKNFEAAHVELGKFLGYTAENSNEKGAPDPWWKSGERFCIVFEDHSDGRPGNELPLEKARQAALHSVWVRENVNGLAPDAEVLSVLVTPADVSSKHLQLYIRDVAVWHLEDFRKWAEGAISVVRNLRARLTRPGDLVWRAEALEQLASCMVTPGALKSYLFSKRNDYSGNR